MEKFYLEMPSLERKEQIIDYVNEFALYNSETNGMGSLRKILEITNTRSLWIWGWKHWIMMILY